MLKLKGKSFICSTLGLATHEVNFTILREEFKPNQKRPCEICAQVGMYKNLFHASTKQTSSIKLKKNYNFNGQF